MFTGFADGPEEIKSPNDIETTSLFVNCNLLPKDIFARNDQNTISIRFSLFEFYRILNTIRKRLGSLSMRQSIFLLPHICSAVRKRHGFTPIHTIAYGTYTKCVCGQKTKFTTTMESTLMLSYKVEN